PDIDAASPKRDAERYRRFLVIAGRCTAGAVFGAVLCLAGVAALTWTGRMTDGPLVAAALAPGLLAVALCSAVPMLLGQGGRRPRGRGALPPRRPVGRGQRPPVGPLAPGRAPREGRQDAYRRQDPGEEPRLRRGGLWTGVRAPGPRPDGRGRAIGWAGAAAFY